MEGPQPDRGGKSDEIIADIRDHAVAKRCKPRREPKRGRLGLNDGPCVRLRPCWPGHVWAYDFVQDRTHDGRRFRMLTVIDEYTRECLAIVVARRLTSDDVRQVLTDRFVERGPPGHIRSDNGPEFVAKVVRGWLGRVGMTTLFIGPGSPYENDYNESLNGEVLNTLREAQALIEEWRRHYNRVRPHSSFRYRPPAPETMPVARPQNSSGAGAAALAH